MIHWAWLILAFIGGLFIAWVYWVIIDWHVREKLLNARIEKHTGYGPPLIKEGTNIPPKQPPDSTKPDLKRPPRIVKRIDIQSITYHGDRAYVEGWAEFGEPKQPIDDGPASKRIEGVG